MDYMYVVETEEMWKEYEPQNRLDAAFVLGWCVLGVAYMVTGAILEELAYKVSSWFSLERWVV